MGFSCPKCNESIDGVIKQDVMTERLKSQRETLETKVADAVNGVESAYQAKLAELETANAKIANEFGLYQEMTTRAEALRVSGITADKHETFFVLYDASQAGKVNGDTANFSEWLTSAAPAHPVLGSHFPQAAAPTEAVPTPAPATPASLAPVAPRPLPNLAGAVASPPDAARKMSPQEVGAYFRSEKYRSLSTAEQQAEQQRIQGEIS
tara:strand:- start:768 stop:1394 length:627 start_codon:yes stop_codon:yes gene_type:complete